MLRPEGRPTLQGDLMGTSPRPGQAHLVCTSDDIRVVLQQHHDDIYIYLIQFKSLLSYWPHQVHHSLAEGAHMPSSDHLA